MHERDQDTLQGGIITLFIGETSWLFWGRSAESRISDAGATSSAGTYMVTLALARFRLPRIYRVCVESIKTDSFVLVRCFSLLVADPLSRSEEDDVTLFEETC